MRLIIKIGIGLAAVMAVLLGVVSTRPDSFRVERSTTVAAPADVVFAQVNDFHAWSAWSPYFKLDPAQKLGFDGAPSGVGAIHSWQSEKVGEGRMTIVESRPNERVATQLEFIKPMSSTAQAVFTFAPAPGGVTVSWAMEGRNTLLGKVFALFVDMDELLGKDFERGLADLKTVSETRAREARLATAP
ncbi:MAG: SRPBCC family protein [Myxococcota bacterium]